jgi:hypothetical protein
MRDIKDESSHAKVDKELIECVGTNLNVSKSVNATVLREFLAIILVEIYRQDVDVSVLKTGSQSAITYADKGKF